MDVNFEDFNSQTTRLAFLKYNLENSSSDVTPNSFMTIENAGALKVGTSADSMNYITTLNKNTWYNFKFHYKPYNVVGGKNSGLMVDVYFIKVENCGYEGGLKGDGHQLDYLTVITLPQKIDIITVFPSDGIFIIKDKNKKNKEFDEER